VCSVAFELLGAGAPLGGSAERRWGSAMPAARQTTGRKRRVTTQSFGLQLDHCNGVPGGQGQARGNVLQVQSRAVACPMASRSRETATPGSGEKGTISSTNMDFNCACRITHP